MEGERGAGTTYGSSVQFLRSFFWEKQNEEMSQETKTWAKLKHSIKRYMKEKCVKCGLASSGSGYAE